MNRVPRKNRPPPTNTAHARGRRHGHRGGREEAPPDRRDPRRRPVQEAHQGHRRARGHRRPLRREVQRAGRRRQRLRLPARQGAAQDHRTPLPEEVGDQVKTEVLLASLEQLAEDHDIAPLSRAQPRPGRRSRCRRRARSSTSSRSRSGRSSTCPTTRASSSSAPSTPSPTTRSPRRSAACSRRRPGRAQAGRQRPDRRHHHRRRDHARRRPRRRAPSRKRSSASTSSWPSRTAWPSSFAEQVKGPTPATSSRGHRAVHAAADAGLRGKTVQATFDIKDVKTLRLPGADARVPAHLRRPLAGPAARTDPAWCCERRLEYTQRQSAREQVIEQIAAAATWELPQDLLMRQARKALARRVMEMQADGIAEEEIASGMRLLQQDILERTGCPQGAFRPAEDRRGREDRRRRGRHQRRDRAPGRAERANRRAGPGAAGKGRHVDALAAEMIERKALDLILDSAEYEDVPLNEERQEPRRGDQRGAGRARRDAGARCTAARKRRRSPAAENDVEALS